MIWWAILATAGAASPAAAAESGIASVASGNLDRAVADLDEALAKADKLKVALRAEAFLSRAVARTGLAAERPELAIAAVDDLAAAVVADGEGALNTRIVDARVALFAELGTLAKAAGGDAEARPLWEAAAALEPEQIDVRYRLCTAAKSLDDRGLAVTHCQAVLDLVQADGAVTPDPALAQAALVLAASVDGAAAEAALKAGAAALAVLDARRAGNRELYTDAQWAEAEQTRNRVAGQLDAALQQQRVTVTSATASPGELADAAKSHPTDYGLQVAYGDSLRDDGKTDDALAAYTAAIGVDGDRPTAYVRAANIWVARAAAAQDAEDDDGMIAHMEQAHALLQKAFALQPDDGGIKAGLLQACQVVGDEACVAELGG